VAFGPIDRVIPSNALSLASAFWLSAREVPGSSGSKSNLIEDYSSTLGTVLED